MLLRFDITTPVLFLIFSLFFTGCASSTVGRGPSGATIKNTVVFTSDFGLAGDGVAIAKGVFLSGAPDLKIVDLTHEIPTFSVDEAARLVANTAPFFPPGTVFLTLVDRHVKGVRKAIVLKTNKGQYFVQPDNGLITLVAERDGISEIREVVPGTWVTKEQLKGAYAWREVYIPVASRLAQGEAFESVGPVLTKPVTLNVKAIRVDAREVNGEVVALDNPFGNLITNMTSAGLLSAGYSIGDKVPVQLGGAEMLLPFVKTFDDVPVNTSLLYVDSTDHVAIAINQGNFAAKHKIKPGAHFTVPRRKK